MRPLAYSPEVTTGDHPLRDVLNVASDADYRLLMTWVTAALRPFGPYPVLVISGQQGSAKSCLARLVRSLTDPSSPLLRGAPHDIGDLVAAAKNNHVVAFDNLSAIRPELADQICRLATGGGLGRRKLYSDSDDAVFDAQRPIIMNGIPDLATRGDLADRALVLALPPVTPERRRSEQDLKERTDQTLPTAMKHILDAMVLGIRRLPEVRRRVTDNRTHLPRMADFALWGMAVAPGIGWTEEDFFAAYRSNHTLAQDAVLDGDPVAVALLAFMEKRLQWKGSATELLAALQAHRGLDNSWPGAASALGQHLRRLEPALHSRQIHIESTRSRNHRSLVIRNLGLRGESKPEAA
jgi:hypothetical protein